MCVSVLGERIYVKCVCGVCVRVCGSMCKTDTVDTSTHIILSSPGCVCSCVGGWVRMQNSFFAQARHLHWRPSSIYYARPVRPCVCPSVCVSVRPSVTLELRTPRWKLVSGES